jgi:flagellar motor switch protein FliN/FliY
MSEASSAQPAPETEVLEYMKMWVENSAQVLSQIAGAPFTLDSIKSPPPEAPAAAEHDLQMTVVAAGSLRGEMTLRVPQTVVLGLGQLFMQEPQDTTVPLKPDHRDALEELLRQAAGLVTTPVSSRWGETQLRVQSAVPPTWSAGARGWLVSTTGAPPVMIEWQLSSALVAALRPAPERPDQERPVQERPVQEKDSPEPNTASATADGKLDLLMDVELDVTLRFSKRSMLLREVMELDAGSVVELDREVQDPADLLLEGRLIARGEVVIVDGNYGLRVLEIISPPRTGSV